MPASNEKNLAKERRKAEKVTTKFDPTNLLGAGIAKQGAKALKGRAAQLKQREKELGI